MEAIYFCMTLHCTKIMLLVIKSPTNYGFHFFAIEVELYFLINVTRCKDIFIITHVLAIISVDTYANSPAN